MDKFKLITILLLSIVYNVAVGLEYYIEIICGNNKETSYLKDVIKNQNWYVNDNKTVDIQENVLFIGPYELSQAQKIKQQINTELNLIANIVALPEEWTEKDENSQKINGDTIVYDQIDEDIEISSYSRTVDVQLIDKYNDKIAKKVLSYAIELYTTPYKWGGENIDDGIDCSYFVKYIFSRLGIVLPRTAKEQFKVGKPIDKTQLRCGDLVFFKKTYYRKYKGKIKKYETINHVGIYIGNNEFIHATRSRKKVTISSLQEPYYFKHYAGAKRVILD